MQVPFIHGPGDLRLVEIERPVPGPDDVLLQVQFAGICGSDLAYTAIGGIGYPSEQPIPLGHELSAIVAQVGENVTGFALGDRVVVNPLIKFIGNGGPEGGFAEYLLVRDVASQPESLLKLPAGLSFEVGALVEPLAVSLHALNRVQAKPGEKVAIFGAGPIGLGCVVMLRQRGIKDIVVFDLSELRRERAMALGATAAFDPREHSPAEMLGELHGAAIAFGVLPVAGTDLYLDTAGAPHLIPEIAFYAKPGARIGAVAIIKGEVTLNFQLLLGKELSIIPVMGYPTEIPEVIALLQNSAIDLTPMVSHRLPGAQFMDAFALAKQPDKSAKILVDFAVPA
jgi:(R,R)-butanediol dehydrogenase / meso-butanediol dehydrogenase / diacetyl reductase